MRDSTEKIIERKFEEYRHYFDTRNDPDTELDIDLTFEDLKYRIVCQFGGFCDALHQVGELSFEDWSRSILELKALIKEYENKQ